MPSGRQPHRALFATVRVVQPQWLGGLSLQNAVFDGRVPFEDCLGCIDVLCSGVSRYVVDLLEQTSALAKRRQAVFVDVRLALYERGGCDASWPVLAQAAFRIEEISEAPRYWRCRRARRGRRLGGITARPDSLAETVAELTGVVFAKWAAGLWGLTAREADHLRADPDRRPPEWLLHCARN